MKQLLLLLLFAVLISIPTFGQDKKIETNYSDPFQIDSSENFNGDKSLNSDDPVYLFLSTKTGDNLKQITPQGFHVYSWTVSKDKKMILVKGKADKNGDKKFGQGDDDIYYRIDLNTDISKIKCEPISM